MKDKIYRHLIFWLAAVVQGTVLEYAWIHTIFLTEGQGTIILQAFCFNLALMPAPLFFTYYALHVVVRKPFRTPDRGWLMFLKLGVALFVAVTIHRLATAYFLIPREYPHHGPYGLRQLFNPPWMLVAMLDIGYVAGVAVALKLFRMQNLSLEKEKALVKDKLETELKFLKNQINPHFLFNTLNNIYALARKKSNETPEVVVRLANLLRFMLYESANETITVAVEIRILEDYVELEKIRYTKRVEICFKKEIDNYEQRISPLILLPFIENAFKHGLKGPAGPAFIHIQLTLASGQLTFRVKNSHHNQSGQIKENIGLKNVRRQLELTYSDFSLEITNLEQTFLVDLNINLDSNGKL